MKPSHSSVIDFLSPQQWLAIFLFMAGLATVELAPLESRRSKPAGLGEPQGGKIPKAAIDDPLGDLVSNIKNDNQPDCEKLSARIGKNKEDESWAMLVTLMHSNQAAMDRESRLQNRTAVVTALYREGYVPDENRTLREFRLALNLNPLSPPIPVRYEWWHLEDKLPMNQSGGTQTLEASEVMDQKRTKPSAILLVWARDEDFIAEDSQVPCAQVLNPIERLRVLAAEMVKSCDEKKWPCRFTVLGPSSSDMLVRFFDRIGDSDASWTSDTDAGLNFSEIEFISAQATASDKTIVSNLKRQDDRNCESLTEIVNKYKDKHNFSFRRTIDTDDKVMADLVRELGRRGVLDKLKGDFRDPKIIIFSERDQLFNRGLPVAFKNALIKYLISVKKNSKSGWFPKSVKRDEKIIEMEAGKIVEQSVKVITYFRGLDGRFSADATQGKDRSESTSQGNGRGSEPDSAYAPVGLAQNDSLRRIGNVLSMEMSNGQKVGAVGILGADIFDKLLICRAIQPILKRQLFFTNNLDAWYWDPDEFPTCAGMIVASPYGLETLPSGDGRQDSDPKPRGLPFRNSYQASVYWSALEAVTYGDPKSLGHGSGRVENNEDVIYEIESNGPVLLQDRKNYIVGRRKILCFYLPCLALVVMLIFMQKHFWVIVGKKRRSRIANKFTLARKWKIVIEKVAWFFSPVNFLVLMTLGSLLLSFVTISNKTILVVDNRMTSWFYIGLLSVTVTVLIIGIGYLQFPCKKRKKIFENTYSLRGRSKKQLPTVSWIEKKLNKWIFLNGRLVFRWSGQMRCRVSTRCVFFAGVMV